MHALVSRLQVDHADSKPSAPDFEALTKQLQAIGGSWPLATLVRCLLILQASETEQCTSYDCTAPVVLLTNDGRVLYNHYNVDRSS